MTATTVNMERDVQITQDWMSNQSQFPENEGNMFLIVTHVNGLYNQVPEVGTQILSI